MSQYTHVHTTVHSLPSYPRLFLPFFPVFPLISTLGFHDASGTCLISRMNVEIILVMIMTMTGEIAKPCLGFMYTHTDTRYLRLSSFHDEMFRERKRCSLQGTSAPVFMSTRLRALPMVLPSRIEALQPVDARKGTLLVALLLPLPLQSCCLSVAMDEGMRQRDCGSLFL